MSFNIDFFIETFFLALTGIPTTLKITVVTLLISIPFGFLLAVIRINKIPFIARLGAIYVSFIRGTPIVVQILIIYSMVPSILAIFLKSVNSSINVFDINPILYAYIVFSLNTIAILSEVFRSALLTVNKGQLEAAQSIGLTSLQSYRRIIIPQALVAAVPNICSAAMNLVKATSLAFLMTVKDVTAIAKVEAGFGYNYIEAYLDVWIIYLIICSLVEILFRLSEKNLKKYKTAVG